MLHIPKVLIMERSVIVFSVSMDYDGDCVFYIDISRPDVKTHTYFYGNADTFKAFGKSLMAFPKDATDTVEFQAGQDGHPSSLSYLLMCAYCASPYGHTALKVIVDNNEKMVSHSRFEFSIASEAASINKLGSMLAGWHVEDTPQIIWKSETR
ncbi:MAG: hypothetical protein M3Y54_08750 [Bacteroidota bacterium]|nr:hypothetical protein [Bacteroidota bacterium]